MKLKVTTHELAKYVGLVPYPPMDRIKLGLSPNIPLKRTHEVKSLGKPCLCEFCLTGAS